ncbi:TPA: hypothetical protein N0F65_001545 [Lagenidium giganteum]|uniref:Chromo domain-containing protein n=1 Tax=Lagenidium giganteum TaxID=4803 RepID=A0AAV2YPI6_9STRA|nr:TPA: hypothetical protein N0F65_001545 [Lagenidium giganteum]
MDPVRPTIRVPNLPQDAQIDFDAALLSIDSFQPPEIEGEFEVEEIIAMQWTRAGRSGRKVREYRVKWLGYDSTHNSWVSEDDLHCPQFLHEFDSRRRSSLRLQTTKAVGRASLAATRISCHSAAITTWGGGSMSGCACGDEYVRVFLGLQRPKRTGGETASNRRNSHFHWSNQLQH